MIDLVEQLLQQQNECTLCWTRADGSPAATIVSCLWAEQAVWMTAVAGSGRVKALARDGRAAVVLTGKGTALGESRCVSMPGQVVIRREAEIRDWFFPSFANAVLPGSPKGALMMAGMMHAPENLVLQFLPARYLPWDSHEMMAMANNMG